jgi:hypothetical protein
MQNRRAVVRYPSGQDVLCTMNPSNSGFILGADVRDLTISGVALVIRKQVAVGVLISIDLPGEGGDTAQVLEAKVVEVMPYDGRWMVRCTFVKPLSPAQMKALA